MSFPSLSKALALGAALISTLTVRPALAQPTGIAPVVAAKAEVVVTLSYDEKGNAALNWDIGDVSLMTAVEKVAAVGDLGVIISSEITKDLKVLPQKLSRTSPDGVLLQLCSSLKLSCVKKDGVWFIGPVPGQTSKKEVALDLNFVDVNVADLINVICDFHKVTADYDPQMKKRIAYIHLSSTSVEDAFDNLAKAAGLKVTKVGKKFAFEALSFTPQNN